MRHGLPKRALKPPQWTGWGSWVSCNFCCCLVVTSFSARLDLLSYSLSHYAAAPSCFAAHWRTRLGLAITTTFDNNSGAGGHILGIFVLKSVKEGSVTCTAVQCRDDSEGVPRGVWIASREGGWAPLYYVTFKSGLTRRNLPREFGKGLGSDTLCSRKLRLSCSGLELCASTEAAQHSSQRCKTLSPERNVGLQNPRP